MTFYGYPLRHKWRFVTKSRQIYEKCSITYLRSVIFYVYLTAYVSNGYKHYNGHDNDEKHKETRAQQ